MVITKKLGGYLYENTYFHHNIWTWKTPYLSIWFLNYAPLSSDCPLMYPHVDLFLLKSDGSPVLWNLASVLSPRHLHLATSVHSEPPLLTLTSLKKVAIGKKWLDLVSESCSEFLSRDSYWDARGMECFEMTERGNALKFIMSGTFVLPWYIGSISACMLVLLSTSSFRIPLVFLTLLLFITRVLNNIVPIVSIKPGAIYFYLNAALHTFTLALHITCAGYRPSLVKPAGPGPQASAGQVSSGGIYSPFSHFLWAIVP